MSREYFFSSHLMSKHHQAIRCKRLPNASTRLHLCSEAPRASYQYQGPRFLAAFTYLPPRRLFYTSATHSLVGLEFRVFLLNAERWYACIVARGCRPGNIVPGSSQLVHRLRKKKGTSGRGPWIRKLSTLWRNIVTTE